jgi:CheY-like chemotaxis protein
MTPVSDRFGYPDFTGKTILIVDDHQDSLDFLSELLGFCGAEVWTAWSTAHARAKLDLRVPALIVCDFQLPRETGVEFIRWLRLQPGERAAVPAVAVTAYPDDFFRHGDDAMAFDAHFVKPLDAPRFLRTLDTILSRPATPRNARSA